MTAKWCSEEANCKLYPSKEEKHQQSRTDGDPELDLGHLPYYKLTHQTCAKQENTSDNKIQEGPIHFICELHRY